MFSPVGAVGGGGVSLNISTHLTEPVSSDVMYIIVSGYS